MNQKEFRQILDRYIKGSSTSEEQKLVEKWYEEVGNGSHLLMNDRQQQEIEARIWSRIAPQSANKSQAGISYWKVSAVAASIVLVVTLFILIKPSSTHPPDSLSSLPDFEQTISNDGQAPKAFLLEDGTQITLQPNSQLLYSGPFKKR